MSRLGSVCLCAVVAFAVLAGGHLLRPERVLAASGTLSMETPLHESPDPGAPLVALLHEGTTVTITGPPVEGFYPVTAGELYGWMRGETILLQKEVAGESAASPASWESGETPSAEQTSAEPPPPAEMAPASAPAAEPAAPQSDPTLADTTMAGAAPADPAAVPAAGGETVADPALGMPAAASADTAAPEVATETLAATPVPAAPAPEPTFTPVPTAEPAPLGPASATVDAPIRAGPGADYGVIFVVPLGSTVEQTGNVVEGYVTVQYKEVTGWAARDQLGAPIAPEEETLPEQAAVDTMTPRPGSGVAFTTVDLSLRAGPSATETPLAAVPAGSRVILTGVMESGFQRVEFRDQLGWIAAEFLSTPADPEPDGGRRKGTHQNYSRQQIVRIIYDAADRYDQDRDDMLRVAECESNLDPYAVNPSGSYGLFQFIRSTWRSTPFGGEDIFDPRANANAAGWMWAEGRKSEWVCQ